MTNRHRNRRTTGDMISTLAFLGMAGWLASEAAMGEGGAFRVGFLWLSAMACFAGGLRHVIAALVRKVQDDRAPR